MNTGIYDDGELYDLVNAQVTEDIPFYQDVVRQSGGDVLELACGTGRITLAIAPLARTVVGVDFSPQMLEWARKKTTGARKPEWLEGDMSAFDLGRQFDLVLIPYNALQHLLTTQQALACFDAVARHLRPGGRLVFDVFNPSLAILTRSQKSRHPIYKLRDAQGRHVVIEETNVYDDATQINRVVWHYTIDSVADAVRSDLQMRQYFPQELDYIVATAGFTTEIKYGNYDRRPFASGEMKQIFVCTA